MSQWHCQLDDAEVGPISFPELVALVRAGRVTESVRVRREGANDWMPAWNVIGLFSEAQRLKNGEPAAAETSMPAAEAAPALTVPAVEPSRCAEARAKRSARSVRQSIAAAGGGLAVVVATYGFTRRANLVFPKPQHLRRAPSALYDIPLFGDGTALECGLFYFDLFLIAAAAVWILHEWASTKIHR
ncbi:MAG TPA: DUF4339 domain-containing protein [Pirellulales bacterium]|nr:DUF4339 domain-containing protein [Pirellulales bacterium]